MSAWLLPDHIADVLPAEAKHLERLRRLLLDTASGYGYELVIPPLVEHLDSLLTGTGKALDLQTFKLVDQLSGRTLGLRADTTPQVARIDAHLLGRQTVTRLCYCGPVLHTRPECPHATREPLQFGAEIYGHASREADLEVLLLALEGMERAGVGALTVDLADARIPRTLLAGVAVEADTLVAVHAALSRKDASALAELTRAFPQHHRQALQHLIQLYGDASVLDEAEHALGQIPGVDVVLSDLRWLSQRLHGVRVSFDLAESLGWGYYTGMRFGVFVQGAGKALLRGGRYDGVGAVFGHKLERDRPAVGFSLDLKGLTRVAIKLAQPSAICAPWDVEDELLQLVVAALRGEGETVICLPPEQYGKLDGFCCDRQLVKEAGGWRVQPLPSN